MPQSSIREGLDSGATRINQRRKRNQQLPVWPAAFLTAVARSQRGRRGKQTLAKKSVDTDQATAYTDQTDFESHFQNWLRKKVVPKMGGDNERT